ncbi:outer membrane beta-barrel protein [Kangiella geojedonensis]|uniref:Outer membrane protein beta-barrel domain-containing protein n=1 Tax=Kangiella geojedonensis TaxID=914150 RepID=A0A0F6TRR2_9GAMM|nr:outer membrane beta-barrel protein [Kangiella geojedonensis]AKE52870.1 hypothetical protein TQ33_1936 [Kangiella geojedonensis]
MISSKKLQGLTGGFLLLTFMFVPLKAYGDAASKWYWGVGYGVSDLEPEGESAGWSASDSSDNGFKLYAGLDINSHWGFDISYYDLGTAGLANEDPALNQQYPNEGINYRVISGVMNYFPWSQEDNDIDIYGKLGVSAIRNTANTAADGTNNMFLPSYEEETSLQFAFGLGLKWDLGENLFMRAEVESFASDAHFYSLQFGGYF